jgi:hypothetical protein
MEMRASVLAQADASPPETSDTAPTVAPPVGTANAPRAAAEILTQLGAHAANELTLDRARGGASHDAWAASLGGRSILITRAERDLLEADGAEQKLPGLWFPCE